VVSHISGHQARKIDNRFESESLSSDRDRGGEGEQPLGGNNLGGDRVRFPVEMANQSLC